jgi:hypothetical protein
VSPEPEELFVFTKTLYHLAAPPEIWLRLRRAGIFVVKSSPMFRNLGGHFKSAKQLSLFVTFVLFVVKSFPVVKQIIAFPAENG